MDGQDGATRPHNFDESLAVSHAAESLPIWEECYRKAFPAMVGMHRHTADGNPQRRGVDRSITLSSSKQILVDEKIRQRNKKTGRVYEDIALEYLGDRDRGTPGWVVKPLIADYIAYAIGPLGRCYLLPVPQLQRVWIENRDRWQERYRAISAHNFYRGREWVTMSLPVPVKELFGKIGDCLRPSFSPFETCVQCEYGFGKSATCPKCGHAVGCPGKECGASSSV